MPPNPRRILLQPGKATPSGGFGTPSSGNASGGRPASGNRESRTRMHPFALLHWSWIVPLLIAAVIWWALANPRPFYATFHVYSGSWLANTYWVLSKIKIVSIGLPLGIALLGFAYAYSYWMMTYVELDGGSITYRIGIFQSNSIPRGAIQDIQFTRDLFGIMFNYGTLRLYAGRGMEVIPFMPNVEALSRTLRGSR